MTTPKQILRTMLAGLGLLHASRLMRVYIGIYVRQGARGLRQYRAFEAMPRRVAEFIRRYADTFGSVQTETRSDAKRVLIIGGGVFAWIEVELCLVKALELAGWRSMLLLIEGTITKQKGIAAYYSLLSSRAIINWHDYFDSAAFRDDAETAVLGARSLEELLAFRIGTVRVGGHAVSTARHKFRAGTLDLENETIRIKLIDCLAASMASASAMERLVGSIDPLWY